MPYCFSRSSIKFPGHKACSESSFSKITRPVAAIKSLRFALFHPLLCLEAPGRHHVVWTSVDFSQVRFCDIHLRAISLRVHMLLFHIMGLKIILLKLLSHLLRRQKVLTHWSRDKMAAIFQTTFSNGFSWMKIYQFRLIFHWNLFQMVQLATFQHWFR